MSGINGKWIFNEVLNLPDKNLEAFDGSFVNWYANPTSFYRRDESSDTESILYSVNTGWEVDRIISIVATDDEADESAEFYQWLVANATPYDIYINQKYSIKRVTLATIADAIRGKTGSTENMAPEEMPAGVEAVYDVGYAKGQAEGGGGSYDEGYTAGQQFEYDRFWDAFQSNGSRQVYTYAFSRWSDDIFNPKYIPLVVGTGSYMFQNSTITSVPPISLTAASLDYLFNGARNLLTIEMIDLPYNVGSATGAFTNCSALQNITFGGTEKINCSVNFSPCPLTNASAQSIIDYLADRTGATALTLTLHATTGGNLTQEQKDAITAKNWTLAY